MTSTSPRAELSGMRLRPMGRALMGESVFCQRFSRSMKLIESRPMYPLSATVSATAQRPLLTR